MVPADINNFAPLPNTALQSLDMISLWLTVCLSMIMLCEMLKYGTTCYLAVGLLCFWCSIQIRYFFFQYMHIKGSINQSTLNRTWTQWLDIQLTRPNNGCLNIMKICMLILKLCDSRLPCDISAMFTCFFYLFLLFIALNKTEWVQCWYG